MKIAAPLRSDEELEPLVRAGADEVFCGVMDLDRRPDYFPNGRPQPSANLSSFRELEDVSARAQGLGIGVLFCANAPQGRVQTGWLKDDILRACAAGVSGIILGDPCLLPWTARNAGSRTLVMGTLSPTLNQAALELLAAEGVNRVVLERLLTLDEISSLSSHARALGLDVEILTATACVHVNAFCHYHRLHACWTNDLPALVGGPYAPCRRSRLLTAWEKGPAGPLSLGEHPLESAPDRGFCGLCSLPRLEKAGVAFIKIPGRENPLPGRLRQLGLLRGYLRDLEAGRINDDDCMAQGRLRYRKAFGTDCSWEVCQHYETFSKRRAEA